MSETMPTSDRGVSAREVCPALDDVRQVLGVDAGSDLRLVRAQVRGHRAVEPQRVARTEHRGGHGDPEHDERRRECGAGVTQKEKQDGKGQKCPAEQ